MTRSRALRAALVGLLVVLLGLAGAAAWWVGQPLALERERVELSIEAGSSPREIAQAWVQAGVRTDPRLLYEWFRWSGQARRIRAGSYEIEAGATPRSLLAKLVQGDETIESVRLIDGWTFDQWRAELARAPYMQAQTAGWSNAQVMAALGAQGEAPEGRFFPDTYVYTRGVSDLLVMQRAYRAMQRRLAAAWQARSPDTPLKTPTEALTLASIVEKETGLAADRGRIAGVFVNRLRAGMPLQTDPSVIYGLGSAFDGTLHKRDLLTDGPYNTYTRGGLPPTPIAMPGWASLVAALHPAPTQALYFVARGDGSSVFSDNLADHNRAVNQYLRAKP